MITRLVMLSGLSALFAGQAAAEPIMAEPRATRTGAAIRIDGSPGEAAWADAVPFDAFHQTYPLAGTSPTQRTVLRILYDDHNLYFAVTCYDAEPARIVRHLGLRDQLPDGDEISVMLATTQDRRTAFLFTVSAGGGLEDGLITEDTQISLDWDGIWEGAAAPMIDGWSAELRIPLRLLRFESADEQRWQMNVRRTLGRTHELMDSSVIDWRGNVLVSRFGTLAGLGRLEPENPLELSPYAALRSQLRPQYSDPARPAPRMLLPSLDLGLDLHATLTRGLALNATVNPDFGDVEADQLVLNFSNYEVFFPEKRPFFTRGMDLFQPVGTQNGQSPHMLFYSRRIGLDTPILGALKLTGTVRPGLEIGVLDALVMGAADPTKQDALEAGRPIDEERPDRSLGYDVRRPLHLGVNAELPAETPVTRNYFTGVIRGRIAPGVSVGGTAAAATPLDEHCSAGGSVEACSPTGSVAGAVDFSAYSGDGAWGALGQLESSRLSGGPAEGRLLADGTVLRSGDVGAGGYVRAGKLGGEPWRAALKYEYASPRLELNQTGFLRAQNEQLLNGQVALVRPWGPFQEFTVSLSGQSVWSTDARSINLDNVVVFKVEAVPPSYHYFGVTLEHWSGRDDIREITGTGIPFERPRTFYGELAAETDPGRSLVFESYVFGLWQEGVEGQVAWGGQAAVGWRPHPRLGLKLTGNLRKPHDSPFFIEETAPDTYLFADLKARVLSITWRQSLVLTPHITFSLYSQLFSGRGRYGAFYQGQTEGRASIRLEDLSEVRAGTDPSFQTSGLEVNALLRWEYRLGSILYLAYARSAEGEPIDARPTSLYRGPLLGGPATDLLLLKLSFATDL